MEGTKNEGSRAGAMLENTSNKANKLGTESSLSLAYAQGVQQHHRTMRMKLGHGTSREE